MNTDNPEINHDYFARLVLERQQELIAFISFEIGYRWAALGDDVASKMMDSVEGSVGMLQRAVEWAGEFDVIWESLPANDDRRQDFIAQVSDFAGDKFDRLVSNATRPVKDPDLEVQVRACRDVPNNEMDGNASAEWCTEHEAHYFTAYTGKPGEFQSNADFMDKHDALEYARNRAMRLGAKFVNRIGEI